MINLFVNYYKAKTKERQKEIDFCLQKNIENTLIDHIHVFTVESPSFYRDKITYYTIDRPTYQDFFDMAKDYPNDINIICNSDIYFDDTIKIAEQIKDNEVYCLTRWEYNGGNITDFNRMHGAPPEWSQDAWIFRGRCKINDCNEVIAINQNTGKYEKIPFTLGVPGCDNHIAWKFKQAGYTLRNPSKAIKAIHVHSESSRDYGHPYRITGQIGNQWGQLLKVPQ